jgi:PAS domain S-box-containing protein
MEVQAKTKSGKIRRLSIAQGSAPVYEKGKLTGVMISASDHTERKKAEEALLKRNAQLELIHHIQSEIPMNTDLETILIRAAESIGKAFGYYKISINLYDPKAEEIEYLTGWNKTGLPLPRGHRQKLGQGLIGKAAQRRQMIVANDVSKEPDYIPYHLTDTKAELIIPLLVQDRLIGVLDLQATQAHAFSKEDVSVLEAVSNHIAYIIDEKQKEEAVRASEKRFRALTERSSDVVSLISSNGIILYMSPAASRIFGSTPEERVGKGAFDRVHPDDLPTVKSRFSHLLKHPGESATVQVRMQNAEGRWRWIEATGTNLLTEPSVR